MRMTVRRIRADRFAVLAWSLLSLAGCRAAAQSFAIEDCRPFGQVVPEGTTLSLPAAAPAASRGMATLIGYVADSTSGRGVGRTVVLLVNADRGDSVVASTDSVGRFSVDGLRVGRYRYTIRSVNFQQRRDSIAIRPGVDTLRAVITRGPPLCSVKRD
jgi:hypothetical protein